MPPIAATLAQRPLNRKVSRRGAARRRAAVSEMDSDLGNPHNLC